MQNPMPLPKETFMGTNHDALIVSHPDKGLVEVYLKPKSQRDWNEKPNITFIQGSLKVGGLGLTANNIRQAIEPLNESAIFADGVIQKATFIDQKLCRQLMDLSGV